MRMMPIPLRPIGVEMAAIVSRKRTGGDSGTLDFCCSTAARDPAGAPARRRPRGGRAGPVRTAFLAARPIPPGEVAEDAHAGGSLQIMGTPTLFLEGVLGPDQWVEVCFGASEVLALVQAHKQGIKLPAGHAGTCPMDGH